MSEAGTLNCPMCGAAAASDATLCAHCGARLATIACPSCFGLVFVGAKFCSHCGAAINRREDAAASTELCPRCKVEMGAVTVGTSNLRECAQCEGIWADSETLRQICADREKQAAVLGLAAPLPETRDPDAEQTIRYLPCPICRELMNRVNFAKFSHVVVEVCPPHGTWFDRDQLRQIVEFIRAGGLEQARAREIADLREERRLTESKTAGAVNWEDSDKYDLLHDGISAVAGVLSYLLR